MKYWFRNDYSFGAHPKVLEAVCAANLEGNIGYGEDKYTAKAKDRIREVCGCPDAMVEFLVGGTQTNVVACAFLLKPWEAAICPDSGHLNGHEVGAFEATGHKILSVPATPDGKIVPEQLVPLLKLHQDVHLTKPGLVYISNATENGAVYTKAELTALSEFCHANGLLLFVDGARLGCALTSDANDMTLPEFAALCDAFYIGGTKNGAMFGEALVITRPELTDGFFRMKKRLGAVMEKGWIQGAQFLALFEDDLYFQMGRQANEMAARLQNGLKAKGWKLWVESPTNQVFLLFPMILSPRSTRCASMRTGVPTTRPIPWCALWPASIPLRPMWTACWPPCLLWPELPKSNNAPRPGPSQPGGVSVSLLNRCSDSSD